MNDKWILENRHKILLFSASVAVKALLIGMISSYVVCGSIDPNILFLQCSFNIIYVGISIGAIIVMGAILGYYIIRIKIFDNIFVNMMKSDYIITTMYFSMGFLAPTIISNTVMIWLFGIWILSMLLAPFNKEKIILKKFTQYGSLVMVGLLLGASLLPQLQDHGQIFTMGAIISSFMSMFGSGRIET